MIRLMRVAGTQACLCELLQEREKRGVNETRGVERRGKEWGGEEIKEKKAKSQKWWERRGEDREVEESKEREKGGRVRK